MDSTPPLTEIETQTSTLDTMREAQYSHVGWIPNTTGHVYFRNAEVRQGITDCYTVRPPLLRLEDSVSRLIASTSLYDLNDFAPNPATEAKFTRFVVAAESKNRGTLEGKLWMLWHKENKPHQNQLETQLVELFAKLEAAGNYLRERWAREVVPLSHEEAISSKHDKAYRILQEQFPEIDSLLQNGEKNEHHYACIHFQVTNCGFCYLKHDQASSSTHSTAEIDREIQAAYYHLKYLLHLHCHHDAKLDSFCCAHSITNQQHEKDASLSLATAIIRDIKANLIEIKTRRGGQPAFTRNAQGVVTYGKALIKLMLADGILQSQIDTHKEFAERQLVYMDCLISSIMIKQEEASAQTFSTLLFRGKAVLTFILMLLAPLILYSSKNAPAAAPDVELDKLSSFLNGLTTDGITNIALAYSCLALAAFLIAYFFMWYRELGSVKSFLLTGWRTAFLPRGRFFPKKTTPHFSHQASRPWLHQIKFWWINWALPFINPNVYWPKTPPSPTRLLIETVVLKPLMALIICLAIVSASVWIYAFFQPGDNMFKLYFDIMTQIFSLFIPTSAATP